MARNMPKAGEAKEDATPEAPDPVPADAQLGGSSGLESLHPEAHPPLINAAPMNPPKPKRRRRGQEVDEEVFTIKVMQYRVRRDAAIVSNGQRAILRAGKLIDGRSYDIESLQSQGVLLEEVGEVD